MYLIGLIDINFDELILWSFIIGLECKHCLIVGNELKKREREGGRERGEE